MFGTPAPAASPMGAPAPRPMAPPHPAGPPMGAPPGGQPPAPPPPPAPPTQTVFDVQTFMAAFKLLKDKRTRGKGLAPKGVGPFSSFRGAQCLYRCHSVIPASLR